MTPEQICNELRPGYVSPACMLSFIATNPQRAKEIIEAEAIAIDKGELASGLPESERLMLSLIGVTYYEAYLAYMERVNQKPEMKRRSHDQEMGEMRAILFSLLPIAEGEFLKQCEQEYNNYIASKRGE